MELKLLKEWKGVDEGDLAEVAKELQETVKIPTLLILEGDVGAGKTTFTKAFVRYLSGGTEEASSPTYSIITESTDLVHADFYRLDEPEELVHLELDLYLEDKSYFFVEWGREFVQEILRHIDEKFSPFLLRISIEDSGLRKFELLQFHEF